MKNSHFALVSIALVGLILGPIPVFAADKSAADAAIRQVIREGNTATTDTDFKALGYRLVKIAADSVSEDNYSDASHAMVIARDFAKKSNNLQLVHRVHLQREEVNDLGREYKLVAVALKKLMSDPDDAKANQAVGLFRSVGKGEWNAAAAFLQKSGDTRLIAVVRGEIAKPTSTVDQATLSKNWKAAAEKESKWLQQRMLLRAHYWCAKAFRAAPEGKERDTLQEQLGALPIMYLSDLKEVVVGQGPWPYANYGRSGGGREITVDGLKYPLGIGMHPPSDRTASVRFKLNGRYRTLHTGFGLCDSEGGFEQKLFFAVWGDGRKLWESPRPISIRKDAGFVAIDVSGIQTLEIQTICKGWEAGCHAVWLDPYVEK